ncbi:MAG: hypothetical protein JXQ23_09975 [Clostridia bacterium]|nr:hypothetical protein [Clostridia bacterium]
MIKKQLLIYMMIFMLIFAVSCQQSEVEKTGSPSNTVAPSPTAAVIENTKIMDDFYAMADDNMILQELLVFIDENISKVSEQQASMMIGKFESIQKNQLFMIEAQFFGDNTIQSRMSEIYQRQFLITDIYESEDPDIKALTASMLETGYKVETSEGSFFPVVDYSFYKKYSDYLTDEYKEYIDIMAVETDSPAAKDAGLYITYADILDRLLSQEAYISTYSDSPRLDVMRQQYARYVYFLLYGADNTPAFFYESHMMNDDAKTIYTTVLSNTTDSNVAVIMAPYIAILERNNFTLTDEVVSERGKVQIELLIAAGIE